MSYFHHLASVYCQLPERTSSKDVANTRKEDFSPLRDNFHNLYPIRWTSLGDKHREVVVLKRKVLQVL